MLAARNVAGKAFAPIRDPRAHELRQLADRAGAGGLGKTRHRAVDAGDARAIVTQFHDHLMEIVIERGSEQPAAVDQTDAAAGDPAAIVRVPAIMGELFGHRLHQPVLA